MNNEAILTKTDVGIQPTHTNTIFKRNTNIQAVFIEILQLSLIFNINR